MLRSLFLVSLLVTLSASAQQPSSRNAFSIFVSNPSFGWSESGGSVADGGFGVAFERQFTPRISGVVSAGLERYHAFDGATRSTFEVVPIDVVARYHFFTDRRVSPYVGLGGRYVDAPVADPSRFTLEFDGGLVFRAGRSFDVFADYKRGLAERGPRYDPQSKFSAGVRWRF